MQLVVDKIARSFGINEIFKDISFMIDKGEKIGLVGVNGSGKTTLLRCLLAPETVDGGVVRFEPGLKLCGAGVSEYRYRQFVAVYAALLPGDSDDA